MIRHSRLVLAFCAVTAVGLHGIGLWVSDPRSEVEIEAGAGAPEAVLGSSFADMVAGAAQPVSDAAVTPDRPSEEAAETPEPVEAWRPDTPARAASAETERADAPDAMAETADTVIPVQRERSEAKSAVPPRVAADPVKPVPPAPAEVPLAETGQGRRVSESAATVPERPVEATEAAPKETVKAEPETEEEGVQVSRRPQARPRELEQAAARQSQEPEPREPRSRDNSATTAPRNATRGGAAGAESASATRQGRDTARRSDEQGNAAASNYPGRVMRHLARVRLPRATNRGAALVQFSIADGGRLASVGLARASGSARLDRAAVTVVQNAAPFPAPPAGAQRSFSVKIEGR